MPGGSSPSGGFGIFDWDPVTGVVAWSSGMCGIHGISQDDFGGTLEAALHLVHPEDLGAVQEAIDQLRAGGEPRPFEYRIRRPDGGIRHVLATHEIVHRDNGLAVRVVGTVREVSDPRSGARSKGEFAQATEALRRTEERFRALIENSFDVITVFDADGTVVYTTPSARRVLGYEPEELIGRPGHELLHPDDLEVANRAFEAAVSDPGSVTQVIHRIRHKDGSYRTVEIHGTSLLTHPAVQGMVSNLRDITERQEAAEALRRSEAQYHKLVDQAVFGIYRSTLDGQLVAVNPALVELLGFPSAEALTAVNMESLYSDPAERDRQVQRHGRSKKPFSVETRWRRLDGEIITVRLSGRFVDAAEGMPAGFEVAVEDISERHVLEGALRQAQKMEAVGRLAGGVAHDFNNLLTVILGEVDMALGEGAVPAELAGSLERIRASGNRASTLTRQLLSFSRRELVSFEALDLNRVVSEAVEMLGRLIEEDVELELDLDAALWRLIGDRSQIEQLLVNLAVNARDSMPDGGALRISTSNATIRRREAERKPGLEAGEYVRLVVGDSGVGMPEEIRAHAFEPFFTTKADKGTGLGLATCYSIAKQHGGYIDIASVEGVGTTVTVLLPRAEAGTPEVATREGEVAVSGSERILLVEDEQSVREITARMLEKLGYEVVTAADSEEAMGVVGDSGANFDLLITDVVLTGTGGRELAETITARHPEIRVLYVSGYTDDSILRRGLVDRDVTLLRKPFNAVELATQVRAVLDC